MDEQTQKIADLERELKFRDRRINELKNEIDGLRQEVREMEDWVKERDAYLEQFIATFGLELDNDGSYRTEISSRGTNGWPTNTMTSSAATTS
jgi:predicted  nucleic acid-binding Zn-ribbon protein